MRTPNNKASKTGRVVGVLGRVQPAWQALKGEGEIWARESAWAARGRKERKSPSSLLPRAWSRALSLSHSLSNACHAGQGRFGGANGKFETLFSLSSSRVARACSTLSLPDPPDNARWDYPSPFTDPLFSQVRQARVIKNSGGIY